MIAIYCEEFNDSSYADDSAARAGRMEAAVRGLRDGGWGFERPMSAPKEVLSLAHDSRYIDVVAQNVPLFAMASLAAGGACLAAELAFKGEPAFACVRPPGHHASCGSAWGHCTFNNVAVALLSLRNQKRIGSALVIDIDAHTGDGTINVLSGWKEALVFNPYAEDSRSYLAAVERGLAAIGEADIVAVSAGFDAYVKDIGGKLETADFKRIGASIKKTADRLCRGRRFASLEGGYYLPDLGANVAAFCEGFSG
jgi:acetoin utilization deacetylase AcuC-like enzyme